MYADNNEKSLDDVMYLVELANNTSSKRDKLTTMKKAHLLLGTVVQNLESTLEKKKVLK